MERQQQKTEAIERMRSLGIAGCIIEDFRKNDNVQIFQSSLGLGYWADEEQKKVIAEFEKDYGALVYSGITTRVIFSGETQPCTLTALLYVSKHREEWETDRQDIKEGYAFVYVHNGTWPEFSECGEIQFEKTPAGGLRQIC